MQCILLIIFIIPLIFTFKYDDRNKNVFCYYASWSVYRVGQGKFTASDIDPFICTHIAYSQFGVDESGTLSSLDPWADILQDELGKLQTLKEINKDLKTILVIGGSESSKNFKEIIKSDALIENFINTAVEILELLKFDGLALDFDSDTDNKVRLIHFLQKLYVSLKSNQYTLTLTVTGQNSKASLIYDISGMHSYLDFIHLKTYDFYGIWNNKTVCHAPLEKSENPELNIKAVVNYWLRNGVPHHKLILGISFYGHTFELKYKMDHGINSPILGPSSPGLYTQQSGKYGFPEICERLNKQYLIEVFDKKTKSIYGYNNHLWISYENIRSIWHKLDYMKENKLGGAMIWSIDVDDAKGLCGIKYPLTKFVYNIVRDLRPIMHRNDIYGWQLEYYKDNEKKKI